MNASGCGVTVKEYGHALAHDPAYATKAGRIADLTRDLTELLPDLVRCCAGVGSPRSARSVQGAQSVGGTPGGARRAPPRVPSAVHAAARPALRGGVETSLDALGFDVRIAANEATCAAARPAPTRCCSPSSPTRCATASSRTSTRCAGDDRLGQHRLHPASAERHGDAGAALDRGARRRARALTPRYQEHDADPALAAHVHCIWRFEGNEVGAEQASARRTLRADRPRRPALRRARRRRRVAGAAPLLFAGQLTRPLVLRSRGSVDVLGVRFRPAGAGRSSARRCRRAPTFASTSPLHGARAAASLARSLGAADAGERIARSAAYVAAQIACASDGASAIEACVERLRRATAASRSPSWARSPGSASASCSAASTRSSASRRACSASSSGCAASSMRCATRRGRPGPSAPRRPASSTIRRDLPGLRRSPGQKTLLARRAGTVVLADEAERAPEERRRPELARRSRRSAAARTRGRTSSGAASTAVEERLPRPPDAWLRVRPWNTIAIRSALSGRKRTCSPQCGLNSARRVEVDEEGDEPAKRRIGCAP